MFNKNAFRAKVIESGRTLAAMADLLDINSATLTRKMNGESDFSRAEIQKIRDILSLSPADADAIFFAGELA